MLLLFLLGLGLCLPFGLPFPLGLYLPLGLLPGLGLPFDLGLLLGLGLPFDLGLLLGLGLPLGFGLGFLLCFGFNLSSHLAHPFVKVESLPTTSGASI